MAKKSVLIVDDEALMALYLSDIVEDLGYAVVGMARSHQEAMDMAGARPPDIAVVDVSLRGGDDGVGLAAELSSACGTQIIFVSGHANIDKRAEAQSVKPVEVLQKPFLRGDLERALKCAESGDDADIMELQLRQSS